MPTFEVLVQWTLEGYVTVEAETEAAAVIAAESAPRPSDPVDVWDSLEVREDVVLSNGLPGERDERR